MDHKVTQRPGCWKKQVSRMEDALPDNAGSGMESDCLHTELRAESWGRLYRVANMLRYFSYYVCGRRTLCH